MGNQRGGDLRAADPQESLVGGVVMAALPPLPPHQEGSLGLRPASALFPIKSIVARVKVCAIHSSLPFDQYTDLLVVV
jgi:hypothetical protein